MLRELYSKIWNKPFAEMVWDYNSYHGHQVSISMKKERETIHLSEGMIYKYLNLAKESDWLLRVALRVDSRTLESNKCWHFVWKQSQSIIKCIFCNLLKDRTNISTDDMPIGKRDSHTGLEFDFWILQSGGNKFTS